MDSKPLRTWRTEGQSARGVKYNGVYRLAIRYKTSQTWRKFAEEAYSTDFGMTPWATREVALHPDNVRPFVEAVQRGSACAGGGGSTSSAPPSMSGILQTPEGPPTRRAMMSSGQTMSSGSEVRHSYEDHGIKPMELEVGGVAVDAAVDGIKPMELEVGGAAVDAAVEAAMADAGLRQYDTIVLKIGEEVYEFGVSWSLHTSRLPPASRLPVLSPPYPLCRL